MKLPQQLKQDVVIELGFIVKKMSEEKEITKRDYLEKIVSSKVPDIVNPTP